MDINIKISRKVFNDVYLPYLDNEDRYLIFYGGGSSGKSYFIAQRWIYKMIHPEKFNLLVVRQTGDTNRRSTFPLLKQVISNWNLSKHFKKETGMNLHSYINSVRVKEAKRLLSTENMSLYEIAASTGFYDQAYFSKVFSQKYGIVPSEFRKGRQSKK